MNDGTSCGLVLLDKPSGPTSHDVVARVPAALGQRRVGHAGTLDPLATGLLPVVVGPATRLVRFLPASPKEYVGSFRLGCSSTTDDLAGEILERHEGPLPPPEAVEAAARAALGRQLQVPPAYSARKVGGQRLHRLARRGVRVEAPPSEIDVTCFDVEPGGDAETYRFRVVVSGGTYVRAIVRDLGRQLGCGALLPAALRRTVIGPMRVDSAVRPGDDGHFGGDDLRAAILGPEAMPLTPPPLTLDDEPQVALFRAGGAVTVACPELAGVVQVRNAADGLVGIGTSEDGLLRPTVVLPQIQ